MLKPLSRNAYRIMQKSSSVTLLTGENECGRVGTATYCLEVTGSGRPGKTVSETKGRCGRGYKESTMRVEDLTAATTDETSVRPLRSRCAEMTPKSTGKEKRKIRGSKSISQKCSGKRVTESVASHLRQCDSGRAFKNASVIREFADESMLHEYWMRKEEVEEKYRRLITELESEEKAETEYYTRKSAGRGKNSAERIISVRQEYERTRVLLLQQKLVEIEEVLSEYKSQIL